MKQHFSLLLALVTAIPSHAFVNNGPSSLKSAAFVGRSSPTSLYSVASTSSGAWELPEDGPEDKKSNRRKVVEEASSSKYLSGDELHLLRQRVLEMRHHLDEARISGSARRVTELERAIVEAQQVDAEFIYSVAMEKMEAAQDAGLKEEAEQYREQALEARRALPHFQLEGLWVGKYGEHGYEIINCTYVGDTLVAYKLTGEKNVPKGEISFKVDLSPRSISSDSEFLEPIELADSAAQQWGSKYLHRFSGEGQVAAEGYKNAQWMDGQLILVNDYFSFAWLPIGHQVFFGRPSAELTLKLLREAETTVEGEDPTRAFLERCFEETEHLEDEMETSDGVFTSFEQQDYYTQEGCFE